MFGLGEPMPEPMSQARSRALIAFAVGTWIYRLVLFLGIAVLVYHFFVKAIGILLFIVEIWWFVARPIGTEFKAWADRRSAVLRSPRTRVTAVVAGLGLLAAVLPWNARVSAPAVLIAPGHTTVFTQVAGRVERLEVTEGREVAAGDTLAVLSSPDLESRLERARAREKVLAYSASSGAFDEFFRDRAQQLTEELAGAAAERRGLEREAERLVIAAPATGRTVDIEPALSPGQWVAAKTRLAAVVRPEAAEIDALVAEGDLSRLSEDGACSFHPERPDWPVLRCRILRIEKFGSSALPLPLLADTAGGPIPVRTVERRLFADKSHYRVRLVTEGGFVPPHEIRGTVELAAERASPLGAAASAALAVLRREAGF